jgi:hypothetical protein
MGEQELFAGFGALSLFFLLVAAGKISSLKAPAIATNERSVQSSLHPRRKSFFDR